MRVTPKLARVERRAEEVRTPGEPFPDVERIVVVRHDRLGDVVLTLPAIDALKRTYPKAALALMVAPRLRPLAERFVGVDRVFDTDPDAGGVRQRLLEFETDLAVCISRGYAFAWAAARAGVAHRVGTGFRFYSTLFERRVEEHRSAGKRHEVEYALSYAHRAGASGGPARFALHPDDEAAETVRRWLTKREVAEPSVVLHPGSGGSCPRWPVSHYLALAHRLRDARVDTVFTVGPDDQDVVDAIDAAGSDIARIPRFHGQLTELAALLGRAALVVGNSSGPVHLAVAQSTPTLAVHAPWPTCGVSRWGPYDPRGWAVVADSPEAVEWNHRQRREGANALMAGVPPDFLMRCVTAMLEGRDPQA